MMNRDDPLPEIHALSLTELTARLRITIPSRLRPNDGFLDALSDADQIYRNKACLLSILGQHSHKLEIAGRIEPDRRF